MDGFEYLYTDIPAGTEGNTGIYVIFVLLTLFSVWPICMLNQRCNRRKQEPLLPVIDNMVHTYPTAMNPFLKLRIHTYSAADETLQKKPIIIV